MNSAASRPAPAARSRPVRRAAPRVVVTSPLSEQPAREFDLPRALPIADVIEREKLVFRLPTVAMVSGRTKKPVFVLRRDWPKRTIKRGETLTFVTVPAGGGSNGGKQVAGVLATLALAVVAPWAGAQIGAALGLGAIGTNIATAVIGVGGAMAINAIMPKPPTPVDVAPGQVYSVQASGNRATPLEPIPVVYGNIKYPPPIASRPYSEFSGNDQYLNQLHCFSLGACDIEALHIGDTLAWTAGGGWTPAFPGAQLAVYQPGQAVKLFPANVTVSDNVSGQTVPSPAGVLGPFAVNPAGTQIERIAVDFAFPAGIYRVTHTGATVSGSRALIAEYRAIDDMGAPVGAGTWSTLFNEVFVNTTKTPQRLTRSGNVAAARYELRLRSTSDDYQDIGQDGANACVWVGLRGYLENFVTPPGVTLIATRIKASEQLSQAAAGQYFFTGTRRLPAWDAGEQEWSAPAATRAIAWAAADLQRNEDYGLGLDVSQFDLEWLAAKHATWESRGDRFDAVFDRRWVAYDALAAILRAGRTQPVRIGSRIGYVRDEPKLLRRDVFTPRNILRGSIEREAVLFDEDAPSHIVVRFINRETWKEETVECVLDAIGSEKPAELSLFGITDRAHAWREGIYEAACNAYRRDFRTFRAELEGKLLERGVPVLLHDPMHEGTAQIAALLAKNARTLTLDRDVTETEEDEHFAVIRTKDGREWGPCEIASFDGPRQITLDIEDFATVEAQHGTLADLLPGPRAEPAHVSILAGETRLYDGLVVGVSPSGSRFFSVALVNDDQRVHLADQTEIIPAPYTPPALFAPVPEAPVIDDDGFFANARRGTLHIMLEAGWRPAPGAVRYIGEISYDSEEDEGVGAGVNPVTHPDQATWTPIHDSAGTRFTQPVEPRPFTLRVAALGVRQGPWVYKTVTDVPEPQLAPGTVTEPSLAPFLRAMVQRIEELGSTVRLLKNELGSVSDTLLTEQFLSEQHRGSLHHALGAGVEGNVALIETVRQVAVTTSDAFAQMFSSAFVTTPAGKSEALLKVEALSSTALNGALGGIVFKTLAENEGQYTEGAFFLRSFATQNGAITRAGVKADDFDMELPGGVIIPARGLWRGGQLEVPIVGGEIQVDLSGRYRSFYTLLTGNALYKMPLGAEAGADFIHEFKQDGTGGRELTYDPGFIVTDPEQQPLPGANTISHFNGHLTSSFPPRCGFYFRNGGFVVSSDSKRVLYLDPPVLGRSLWDIDAYGPLLIIGPGAWTVASAGDWFEGTARLWGPGGTSGTIYVAGGNSTPNAAAGTPSTFAGMTAGPGQVGAGVDENNGANNGYLDVAGGAGGGGTGGDSGLSGNSGGTKRSFVSSGIFVVRAGAGAAAPGLGGGAEVPEGAYNGAGPLNSPAVPGNAPGGGARGAMIIPTGGFFPVGASPGGGSGAMRQRTFGESTGVVMAKDVPFAIVLGDSGAPATTSVPFQYTVRLAGAKGAPGGILFT